MHLPESMRKKAARKRPQYFSTEEFIYFMYSTYSCLYLLHVVVVTQTSVVVAINVRSPMPAGRMTDLSISRWTHSSRSSATRKAGQKIPGHPVLAAVFRLNQLLVLESSEMR